jgi:hypothetical protein
MPTEHQDLVIQHIDRLNKIIYARSKRDIGRYTDRETAVRQLARMTIVFLRYTRKRTRGELKIDKDTDGDADEVESMVADLVDASFSVDKAARASNHAVIGSINYDHGHELGFGEEQECERLVQEILAESVDQVSELWLLQPAWKDETILPDGSDSDDLGKDVDFDYCYAADATDPETGLTKIGFPTDSNFRPKRPNRLSKVWSIREKKKVDIRWPPKSKTEKSLVETAADESADYGDLRL